MNIYRGMDVGTAKPSRTMQSEVSCLGLDLVSPDKSFSVAAYLEAAREIVSNPEPVLVCGGTGLYLKALSEGLASGPAPNAALRNGYEEKLKSRGVQCLQQQLRARAPGILESLNDPENPRRLIRALERLDMGYPEAPAWKGAGDPGLITGLRVPRDILHRRIQDRAVRMFASGLLEEVQEMLDTGIVFSSTAAQAIGYREALGVLRGALTREEAVEQTALRTRQLVKKQLTWFRNKMEITWVDWNGQESIECLAEKFTDVWAKHECGTVRF